MEEEELEEPKSHYSKIGERINLQDLGNYIQSGSTGTEADFTSFSEREQRAEETILRQLEKYVRSEEKKEELLELITDYVATKIEIYFNLGIKVGAKLEVLLLGNLESDF